MKKEVQQSSKTHLKVETPIHCLQVLVCLLLYLKSSLEFLSNSFLSIFFTVNKSNARLQKKRRNHKELKISILLYFVRVLLRLPCFLRFTSNKFYNLSSYAL